MQRGMTSRRKPRTVLTAMVLGTAATLVLAGCSGGGDTSASDDVIRVVYPEQPPSTVRSDIVKNVAKKFETEHPGKKIELVPINAVDDDYHMKMALMQRSPSSAPDVVLVDSFQVNSQVSAGYLAPLDEHLAEWQDWDGQFSKTARELGVATDGKTYGVPISGGFIGLWYDKSLFAKAGLPTDWEPKTWDDILSAATAIKNSSPEAVPFAAQMTKASGEGTSMQTFEVLLQGTKGGLDSTLYDTEKNEWVTGSDGFVQALTFIDKLRAGDLAASPTELQNPKIGGLMGEWFPKDKVGMALSGNWLSSPWQKGGTAEWPEWTKEMGWTAMPTIDGSDPGSASMTGGWVWSMASTAKDQDAAFDVLSLLTDKENSLAYSRGTGDMPWRDDVAAAPDLKENPALQYFYGLLDVAGIRPGLEVYPQVSTAIQEASEVVVTGAMSPQEAAEAYDKKVGEIVKKSRTS